MDYDTLFSDDTHSFFRSPVREIFKRVDLNSIYSFAGGYPSADTFPTRALCDIMAEVPVKYGSRAFQYGATQGVPELRQAVSRRYGVPVDNIQITTSSQQGIDVCTRVLVNPGDVILASNPTYLGALQSFRSYRANVVGVEPCADVTEYRQRWIDAIAECKRKELAIKFLYIIPDFQNPSGESLTTEQRMVLIDLAREHKFLIIEDSPYRELRYEGDHLPTLYSIAPEAVVHLGSFSKIMAPGFRLGWMFGPAEVLDKVYVCKQSLDLCPPIFDQYVAAEFLDRGLLDENLEHSKALYRTKRDLMLSALEQCMPQGVTWTHPEGGLFLFLHLPEGFDAVKFYDRSLDAGVAYVAGEFFHTDGGGKNTMRLNFSFMTPEKIVSGLRLLGELLKSQLSALDH